MDSRGTLSYSNGVPSNLGSGEGQLDLRADVGGFKVAGESMWFSWCLRETQCYSVAGKREGGRRCSRGEGKGRYDPKEHACARPRGHSVMATPTAPKNLLLCLPRRPYPLAGRCSRLVLGIFSYLNLSREGSPSSPSGKDLADRTAALEAWRGKRGAEKKVKTSSEGSREHGDDTSPSLPTKHMYRLILSELFFRPIKKST